MLVRDSAPQRIQPAPGVRGARRLQNHRVTMRDGVNLAIDVLLPPGQGPFPTILTRTPYDKNAKMNNPDNTLRDRLLGSGYAYAVQDVRGRFNSDGHWRMYFAEFEDGSDTLDWLVEQTWCDGNIGMCGGSYEAQNQWAAAISGHPNLKALAPLASTTASLWDNEPIRGGALLTQMAHYAVDMGRHSFQIDSIKDEMWAVDQESARTLPVSRVPAAEGADATFFDEWIEHPTLDEFWRRGDFSDWDRLATPALNITGWWDMAVAGALANFPAMRTHGATPRARDGQRLVIGPWPHWMNAERELNGMQFGDDAIIDLDGLHVDFFDQHVRGRSPDSGSLAVHVFVLGVNEWWASDTWPLAEGEETDLLLGSGGCANSRHGDGTLGLERTGSADADHFDYDPMHPVHSFFHLCADGPVDDRVPSDRSDVLCFTTEPLVDPLDAVGPVRVHLWAASSAVDTDWHVRLVDVTPQGVAHYLCHGVVRARFRDGFESAKSLVPGEPVEYAIGMDAVGIRFQPGHRIRLEVTSSWMPRYNRNTNSGADNWFTDAETTVAHQTILHDATHPSRLVLPVIPAGMSPTAR
jgi:uncharacterized protein